MYTCSDHDLPMVLSSKQSRNETKFKMTYFFGCAQLALLHIHKVLCSHDVPHMDGGHLLYLI